MERKYDDLNTMNKNLQNEIINLKYQILILKSQIEYHKAKDIGPSEQFRLFQSKNDEIGKLNDRVKELCNELEDNNITSRECNGVS